MTQILNLPITRRAVPTLSGALVLPRRKDGSPATVVYPWTQMQVSSKGSFVYHETGERVCEQGRPIVLKFGRERAIRVARRAQIRAFRQAWQRGDLHIVETIHCSRVECICPAVLLAGMTALPLYAFLFRMLPKMWAERHLAFPNHYWLLLVICLIGYAAIFAMCAWFSLFMLKAAWVNRRIREIHVDPIGVRIRHHDGTEASLTWQQIEAVADAPYRLVLHSSQFGDLPLWGASSRVRKALLVIDEARRPERRREEQQESRGLFWRLTILGCVGTAACGLAAFLVPMDPQRPGNGIMRVILASLAPLLLTVPTGWTEYRKANRKKHAAH